MSKALVKDKKLPREAYKALEDIVGAEYISEEPVVLDSYRWVWGNEGIFGRRLAPFRPLAVVLPGSVEEVSAIVKVCNRFKIKFRAFSTGFETTALTSKEPMLIIDLKRMNRIIFIDEKNRIALVEPCVSLAEFFYECIKRGLRFNVISGGPSSSVVASSACHMGAGFQQVSGGYQPQNLLAVEWVLPTGEVVRLGSMATDSGWFAPHGPGLNLRAILRGYSGTNGGHGIITKVAVRLAPWFGPPRLEVKGGPPIYHIENPENLKLYFVAFPSLSNLIEALRMISEEQIAMCAHKTPLGGISLSMVTTESNNEALEKMERNKDMIQKACYSILVLLDAFSPKELELKESILKKILEETNGEVIQLSEKERSALLAFNLIALGTFRESFRPGGSFLVAAFNDSTIDAAANTTLVLEDILLRYAKEGKIVFMPGESWLAPIAGGQWCHVEQVYGYDAADPESIKAANEVLACSIKTMAEKKLGIWSDSCLAFDDSVNDIAGPLCFNYHRWIRKIRKMLDPNLVCEASWYTAKDE
ncbi:MAG: FAD-binding oxidoreductase [Candidatus Nezhaarchaeota archaeon]|nr:FAD-binding oxidoreductase [Candidatus Nezhaarchaeota archaeon]